MELMDVFYRRFARASRHSRVVPQQQLSLGRNDTLVCCQKWSPGLPPVGSRERLSLAQRYVFSSCEGGASGRLEVEQRKRLSVG